MKRALVLSAGGMFGAYQAGVWQVLEAAFRPEIVVGASAGAINAWAIASGMSGDELAGRWLSRTWGGVCDSRTLEREVRALAVSWRPQVEIGIVATALPSLRPRLFQGGEIGWQHLAASCAVPLCYRQVRIGGRWYSDGGLLGPLPLWAAARMGAERILAVNVLAQLPSRLLGFAVNRLRRLAPRPPGPPDSVPVLTIAPAAPLGPMRDALRWRAESIERFLELGRRDASSVDLSGWL